MSSTHIDALEADNGGLEMAVEVEKDGDRVSVAVRYCGVESHEVVLAVRLTPDDAFIVADTMLAVVREIGDAA